MLKNKRLTIVANSVMHDDEATFSDQEVIASYGAILDLETLEVSFTSRYVSKEACKNNRDMVRSDQADFENYVYDLQDQLKK